MIEEIVDRVMKAWTGVCPGCEAAMRESLAKAFRAAIADVVASKPACAGHSHSRYEEDDLALEKSTNTPD